MDRGDDFDPRHNNLDPRDGKLLIQSNTPFIMAEKVEVYGHMGMKAAASEVTPSATTLSVRRVPTP